jgi:hypothetical protein
LLYFNAMSSVFVNLLPVIVAGIAGTAINTIWYTPKVFGNAIARLERKVSSDNAEQTNRFYLLVVVNLIIAYVLAQFIGFATTGMNLTGTITDGALVGAWVWLGFIATTSIVEISYSRTGLERWTIKSGQYLVSMIIMSVILTIL